MNCTTEVVVSLAGRDKGGIFAVIGYAGEGFALIADGRHRKKEKPKKKKLKHLRVIGSLELPEPSVASNRGLWCALKKFNAADAAVAEGGI
jgi:ribosomal protein L14E/L6E/L27E